MRISPKSWGGARVDNDTGFPSTFFCQMSPYFYQEIVRPLHQKNVPSTKNFLRNEPPGVRPTISIVERISKEKTATKSLLSNTLNKSSVGLHLFPKCAPQIFFSE